MLGSLLFWFLGLGAGLDGPKTLGKQPEILLQGLRVLRLRLVGFRRLGFGVWGLGFGGFQPLDRRNEGLDASKPRALNPKP